MQSITTLLGGLQATDLSVFLRESGWAFPTIESAHVIALALVVGTIAIIDLRLLGLASVEQSYAELSRDVLPWTWAAFALAATTGTLMFVSQPVAYYENAAFRMKFLFLLLAGANMLVFRLVTARSAVAWDRVSVPFPGRIAGALSLAFWIAVVFFGRRVGFTMLPG